MVIFVPTRARIYKQITRKKFHLDQVQEKYPVIYVVPESELEKFTTVNRVQRTLSVPDDFKLSDIRQWLVETQNEPDPHHCCFDDDLVFLRRKVPTELPQRSDTTAKDALDCFDRINDWLWKGYVHGALSQRAANGMYSAGTYKLIGRATDTHFYNAEIIGAEGLHFNDVVLRQDFHMTLSLLERGYPNVIDYEFMSGQTDGTPGGCQVYRSLEMLAEQAQLLADLHPEFVTIVEKERKGGFGVSTDVRIAWMKAFRSRLADRKLPMRAIDTEGMPAKLLERT